jgi:hypothetical protein
MIEAESEFIAARDEYSKRSHACGRFLQHHSAHLASGSARKARIYLSPHNNGSADLSPDSSLRAFGSFAQFILTMFLSEPGKFNYSNRQGTGVERDRKKRAQQKIPCDEVCLQLCPTLQPPHQSNIT